MSCLQPLAPNGDVGGPKRGFLRLVVKAANGDSGIFIGPARCCSLFPNVVGMCLLCQGIYNCGPFK